MKQAKHQIPSNGAIGGINIEGKGSAEQKVKATKPLRQHVRRPQTKLVKKFPEPIQGSVL